MEQLSIEVVLCFRSKIDERNIIELCENYLKTVELFSGSVLHKFDETISHYVQTIIIGDCECLVKLDLSKFVIKWYVYKLNQTGPFQDSMQLEGDAESKVLATSWMLPSIDFHELWENLIYEDNIKRKLLRYVQTTMLFSDKGINSNIVCSNRVLLLHGPPGTGKTSLCKALAHKLSVKLKNRYVRSQLVEINSHSLFSKWFSESGKLVSAMFSKIREIIEEEDTLVCVLIDEVESLAHARQQSLMGNEPSDSIRVVNAVLTEIDQIKRYPNVLILTTSNMTGAIDLAFVDRADIKQFIGLPTVYAIYQIYYSCLQELMRTEIIVPSEVILPASILKMADFENNCCCQQSKALKHVCDLSAGLSGRTLRKIPFIAHSLFLVNETASFQTFIEAMRNTVIYIKKEKTHFEN